ncbi:MAG: hypothetical protein H0W02_18805 [Ktedonobacteraceae bacterium]|nr:hypothetical protein [Ktedonobacteraceae bacterium]
MQSTQRVQEWDDSLTWSGLAAPAYWQVIDRRQDGLMWQRRPRGGHQSDRVDRG